MALTTTVIDEETGLDPVEEAWDALAVETSRPYCAPGWMLAWWRHARPEGAGLRLVSVTEGERLVGIAPLWSERSRGRSSAYDVLTAGLSPPTGFLAAPGREPEVAEAAFAALRQVTPRPSTLRVWETVGEPGIDHSASARSGRPWVHAKDPVPTPIAALDEPNFDAWFAGRSSKFRQESRRMRRRLEAEGASIRMAGEEDIGEALDAFVRLHGARWKDRGGSGALIPGLSAMLADAAAGLMPAGRFRVYVVDDGDEIVAVNILVAAGEQVSGWNSGFDEAWSRYSPSMQLTLQAVEDAIEAGEKRFDLGPGEGAYKRRVADREEAISSLTLVPSGSTYPAARLGLLLHDTRNSLSNRLSPRVKGLLGRARKT